jgi:hypothetical protein
MKDSRGRQILIGDRVKVLWNFDNKVHVGDIIKIDQKHVEVDITLRRISIYDHTKITKLR